jgi:nucleoside-diphosphate-sugar epimerase
VNILVTGSAACLARVLLPRLCAESGVMQVTGIDRRPTSFSHPKFRALAADFRSPEAAALLPAQDALIHLAYVVLRGRMREPAMRAVNIEGSLALLQAARAAGVPRIIHLSSGAVYGHGTNLAETAPLSPLPSFCYGRHKAELETRLEQAVPDCVRLRPHVILGPQAQPTLRRILSLPCYLDIADPQPVLQCVHEEDVVTAILASLRPGARGAYNLAAPDCWNLRDVMRQRHALCLPLPVVAARAALVAAHAASGWGGEPGWLDGLHNTLTLDCRRAARDLDWIPRHSAAQTFAATP